MNNAKFVFCTDHMALKYLMKKRKILLWTLGISCYNCQIEYIPRTQNTCCEDLQSRTSAGEHLQQDDRKDGVIHDNTFASNAINHGGGAMGKNVGPASGRMDVRIPVTTDLSRKNR